MLLHPDAATPLVWFRISLLTGAASDPRGREGTARHAALLARRSAAGNTRAYIDDALDQLGASLNVRVTRDTTTFAGVCLSRNLEATFALCADMVCRPDFDATEHDKLLRESAAMLDDLRDDDEEVALRFFHHFVAPEHPYARTALGTSQSLAALDRDDIAAGFGTACVADNILLGFAGDVDERRAAALEDRLNQGLNTGPAPARPPVAGPIAPRPRSIYLIDKPGRSQSQIMLGHAVPRYGSDDHAALIPVETIFGGTFTSRLNQGIRVERGWSYGAGCELDRARGNYWLSVYMAPAAEVTGPALALTLDMYAELAQRGLGADELDFAKRYLAGSMAFEVATCRQRLDIQLRERAWDLADGYRERLAEQIADMSLHQVNDAAARCLHPDQLCIVIVATADDMLPRLSEHGFDDIQVVAYDSY